MTAPAPIPDEMLRALMSMPGTVTCVEGRISLADTAQRLHYVEARLAGIQAVVDGQANDKALWVDVQTAPEACLQQSLRRLHEAVEGKTGDECAVDALKEIDRERT